MELASEAALDVIERYGSFKGAVLNMTRDEWKVLRAWDEFKEQEARAILHEDKVKWEAENVELTEDRTKMRQTNPGGCDCWIEPDNTYEQITTFDWDYTDGAGVNVDCSVGPLDLGWTFDFYGEEYDAFFINSKGSISFGDYIIDWTPEEFPNTVEETAQVAGF